MDITQLSLDGLKVFEFGQRVKISKVLVRRWEKGGGRKSWKPYKMIGEDYAEALYLGRRTLRNGVVNRDYDEGNTFIADEYIRVHMVCRPGRNPDYVLDDDITILKTHNAEVSSK